MSNLRLTAKSSAVYDQDAAIPPTALGEVAEALKRMEDATRESVAVAPPPFDQISAAAARVIISRWSRPCEAAFELLALRFPYDLVKLIALNRLDPSDLTFAAEALGRSKIGSLVRYSLKPLLQHSSPVVREGAIYGLQRHIDANIRRELEALATNDPSGAVRTAAEDALAET